MSDTLRFPMSDTPITDDIQRTVTLSAHGPADTATHNARAYRWMLEHARKLEREVTRLEALVYVPGVWKCAKCKCELASTTLNVATGGHAANTKPQECPNNCGPMWRVTERDAGNELIDRMDAMVAEVATLKAEASMWRFAVETGIIGKDQVQRINFAMGNRAHDEAPQRQPDADRESLARGEIPAHIAAPAAPQRDDHDAGSGT